MIVLREGILDYIVEEALSKDLNNEIYKGYKENNPNEYAIIKIVSKTNIDPSISSIISHDTELIKELSNDHVVKLKDMKETETEYYIIFEYCNGGDLKTYIEVQEGKISSKIIQSIMIQIIDGLDALFNKEISCEKIKLSNILVTYPIDAPETPTIKLFNFSLAQLAKDPNLVDSTDQILLKSFSKSGIGELGSSNINSIEINIWSLGSVLYELLCGQSLAKNYSNGKYKIPKFLELSTNCIEFLHNCLHEKPDLRFNWKDARKHSYINKTQEEEFDLEKFIELM